MAAATGSTNGAATRMTSTRLEPVASSWTCPTGESEPDWASGVLVTSAMTIPNPPSTQLKPPKVPTSLSPVVHRRDSHTSTTPTTQPMNGITQQDDGGDLQPRGGWRRRPRLDAEALAGLGGDLGQQLLAAAGRQ